MVLLFLNNDNNDIIYYLFYIRDQMPFLLNYNNYCNISDKYLYIYINGYLIFISF